MTTRKYPRSLVEAWPHHYPHSITHYKRPLSSQVATFLKMATFAGALVVCLLAYFDVLVK